MEQKTSQGDPGQDLNLIGHHGARLRGRLWEEPWGLGRVSFSVWFLHPQRWALCSSLWFEKRTSYLETVQVRGWMDADATCSTPSLIICELTWPQPVSRAMNWFTRQTMATLSQLHLINPITISSVAWDIWNVALDTRSVYQLNTHLTRTKRVAIKFLFIIFLHTLFVVLKSSSVFSYCHSNRIFHWVLKLISHKVPNICSYTCMHGYTWRKLHFGKTAMCVCNRCA